jgi:hypothetical protein
MMGYHMSNKLVIWDSAAVPNACILGKHSDIEDPWELYEGVSRAANFPSDFRYNMDPDFPHDTLLVDNLVNTDMSAVVSLRLKQFLEQRGLKKVEYLPVMIMDHRGRLASRDYFIVHPIDPVDCLDYEKSGVRYSEIDPETIQEVKHLVIDESRLDPEREFFRPKGFYQVTFATRALAKAVDEQGFVGIRWVELAKYH